VCCSEMSLGHYVLVALCLAICVQCLPIEPKFRQMSLESEEISTSAQIQAISSRITFLEKLNKLTYDTTLFTRKLRWLLRRSLTEKPSVADVADLMSHELDISKAQIEVAVEGVADELKVEVKQGIIALKAGLAFIEDNYVAGSNPEADGIIAKIKANLASLEARFGQKFGETVAPTPMPMGSTGPTTPEASTSEPPPLVTSTAAPAPEPSTTVPVPEPASTAEASTTQIVPPAASTGSLIEPSVSTSEVPPVQASTAVPPVQASTTVPPVQDTTTVPPVQATTVLLASSSSSQNSSSSSSSGFAPQPIGTSGGF